MRSERGHVFIEIYLLIAAIGIAAAILVPRWVQVRNEGSAHQCALALDGGEAECPLTHTAYVVDEKGARCCPNAYRHSLGQLCLAAGDPPLAAQHPEPSTARRVFWTATGGLSAVLAALAVGGVLLVNVVGFVRSPIGWWRGINRRHF